MAETWEEIKHAAQSAFSDATVSSYQEMLRRGQFIPYEIGGIPFYLDREEYHQYLDEANKDLSRSQEGKGLDSSKRE